jgi:hypothetical protein
VLLKREAIRRSIRKIIQDITQSGYIEMVDKMIENRRTSPEGSKEHFNLGPFQYFSIAYSGYNDDERKIISALALDAIHDLKYWNSLSTETDPVHSAYALRSSLKFAVDNLPGLLKIFEQDHIRSDDIGQPQGLPHDRAVLTINLSEDSGRSSSPTRLIFALESVQKIYDSICELDHLSPETLVVLSCDSGSDKSFDFLGLASAILRLKDVITAIWDRIVFYRQLQMDASLSLIATSLPIVKEVEALAADGTIQREQAELLKRRLVEGCTKFIEAGVTTPEMEADSAHSPRQLMRPEQKLLAGPDLGRSDTPHAPSSSPKPAETSPTNFSLTAEEYEQLRSLMAKASVESEQAQPRKPVGGTKRPRRRPPH